MAHGPLVFKKSDSSEQFHMRETHPTFEKIVPSRPWIADMHKFLVISYKSILIS